MLKDQRFENEGLNAWFCQVVMYVLNNDASCNLICELILAYK